MAYQVSFTPAGSPSIVGSRGIYGLAGVTALERLADADVWDRLIHEDRDAVLAAWEELKATGFRSTASTGCAAPTARWSGSTTER